MTLRTLIPLKQLRTHETRTDAASRDGRCTQRHPKVAPVRALLGNRHRALTSFPAAFQEA